MSEVIIACPICGDFPGRHHKHLHVNEDNGVYYCHLCETGGSLKALLKKFPDVGDMLALGVMARPRRIERTVGQSLVKILQRKDFLGTKVKEYLYKRGLTDDDVFDVWWDRRFQSRAVFVCREQNEIVFWTARSITDAFPKWRFPRRDEMKASRSSAVFGLNWFEKYPGKEVWIVEGVFDAFAVRGIALLGKYCSDAQLRKILSVNPKKIVVALDRNAKDKAEKLAEKIEPILSVEIQYAPLEYVDWGEMLEKGAFK